MAHSSVVISAAARSRQSAERAHRIRVWIAGMAALFFCVAMGVYGFDYYRLPRELRPFSDKHELLRPSGRIGINLGILGTPFSSSSSCTRSARLFLPWAALEPRSTGWTFTSSAA